MNRAEADVVACVVSGCTDPATMFFCARHSLAADFEQAIADLEVELKIAELMEEKTGTSSITPPVKAVVREVIDGWKRLKASADRGVPE